MAGMVYCVRVAVVTMRALTMAMCMVLSPGGNRSAIGDVAGVVEAIVGAMRRHTSVPSLQEEGCRALCNLAWNNGAWRALCAILRAAGVVEHV